MCGRYALDADIDLLIERYKAIIAEKEITTKSEIFPTDFQPIITESDGRNIELAKWGFMPHYAKRPLINARGETVHEKPTFRKSFLKGRCLVPATAFFEWEEKDNKKIKRKISVEDVTIFSMAGLYEDFISKEGNRFRAYTILTTDANTQMALIHDRMPVILSPEDEDKWLDPGQTDIGKLRKLIIPSPLHLIIE
ncbi:SOS response-associated peptidase [Gudongella oleilytica]|uniref:SOS response-associated peptidase n=1 Tax=Gudongella oleilytica TaxID=1582259 RepID=UPI000ED3B1C3|nr:SOS response-associated peptidase [Gudongella oleilytica]MDY0256447.1 SOS response-associated peptidase [Gudongella oleilytica]HCO18281.1 SOS response-associated peptidase [Tissierellales bacterium]